ncbi:DUF4159 domain-containing protein [Magnetospira sp. QH-2]|uniref:DUF4159 domain-containing protein n=1 Tax=Magnetospira sp. (strain QH-2) TaxID=1288970 RepID=UPI0003E814A3|nr:DUF4159 domain-containing protein [Magnetospira sp. QH-2]CCQ72733.1 Conserved membrane protein of unknown function [Magnetospira sp. QH-2]
MLSVLGFTFAAPWALVALIAVPLLLPLLRLMPPPARELRFPAIRFLFGLPGTEETSARTPWWLVLLRLLLLLCLIIGAARPLLGSLDPEGGQGPVLLVVDDGWAAARNWPARQRMMSDLVSRLEPQGRALVLLTTAPAKVGGDVPAPRRLTPGGARQTLKDLQPHPWPTDRAGASDQLTQWLVDQPDFKADTVWLSDSLQEEDPKSLVELLSSLGEVSLHRDGVPLVRLLPPERDGDGLRLAARRLADNESITARVQLRDGAGTLLDRIDLTFAPGESDAVATARPPAELARQLARLDLAVDGAARTVGGLYLLDDSWRRHPVGLATFDGDGSASRVLDPLHYLSRALDGTEDVRRGPLNDLRQRPLALLVLADPPPLSDARLADLNGWIRQGGVLLRFAGPRLADAPSLPLPVDLRAGDRLLGGKLSWTKPLSLAAFPDDGPFAGLAVPSDIKVRRQVLARPESVLLARVWARLKDGTPLVTARRQGRGWLVLFHTTADPRWSDLPLSGLFVEMMRRMARLGPGTAAAPQNGEQLSAATLLNGFGQLTDVAPGTATLIMGEPEAAAPGLYGRPHPLAVVNLSWDEDRFRGLEPPATARLAGYGSEPARDLSGVLWTAAMVLLLIDMTLSLWARGLAVAGVMLLFAVPAMAAPDPSALANQQRLGYVVSGDAQVDETAKAGMNGLTWMVMRRTSVQLAEPLMVNPATDDLALFPLIYWPLPASPTPLNAETARRVEGYLRRGGLILFDGRGLLARDSGERLRRLTGPLRVPRLMSLPAGHVLGRSFYLLQTFPGRLDSGALWVERPDQRTNDGVATVIVGDNDWAAAWAVDETLRPLHAVSPGGERQRELAFRFGINLVMVALTGNYKGDQVHLDAILERLSDDW